MWLSAGYAALTTRAKRRGYATRRAGTVQDLITAAPESGCRSGELLSLQWAQARSSHARRFSCRPHENQSEEGSARPDQQRVTRRAAVAPTLSRARARTRGVCLRGRSRPAPARNQGRVDAGADAGGDYRAALSRFAPRGGIALDGRGVALATINASWATRICRRRARIWARFWRRRAGHGALRVGDGPGDACDDW